MLTDLRSGSGRYIRWKLVVGMARDTPGAWRLMFRDSPVRLVRNINDRSHPDLHLKVGRLESRAVHSYVGPDGVRRADIWVRWLDLTGPEEGAMITKEGDQ